MIRVVRSELVRLRRRNLIIGWLGLTVLFAALINFVMFNVVKQSGAASTNGPGTTFPTSTVLLGNHGLVAGLAAASSFFGVTALAFWALATASDYSTGLIRMIVAAEPRRSRLLIGKWIALALATAAATLVALLIDLLTAPIAASAGGYHPRSWGQGAVPIVLSATLNLYLALLVWGTIGLALAALTRSAGIAIGIGVGWVLLLEAVIKAAAKTVGNWLPGSTISALANGGNTDLSYVGAVALAAAYVAVASGLSLAATRHRDVTD